MLCIVPKINQAYTTKRLLKKKYVDFGMYSSNIEIETLCYLQLPNTLFEIVVL